MRGHLDRRFIPKKRAGRSWQRHNRPAVKVKNPMIANSTDLCSMEPAEGEILASLIVRPEKLATLQIVEPDWFSRSEDRTLWRAFMYATRQNDGLADPTTAKNFIEQKYPGQSESLLDRMVGHINRNYGAGPLADSLLDYHLSLLQTNGIRRTHWKWARGICLCCEQRRSLEELRAIVDGRPGFGKGAGE